MTCPNCGAEVDAAANERCPSCDIPLQVVCPNCGERTPEGEEECATCGSSLTHATPPL
jgi:predicted amidophosphoribosyltransferase